MTVLGVNGLPGCVEQVLMLMLVMGSRQLPIHPPASFSLARGTRTRTRE